MTHTKLNKLMNTKQWKELPDDKKIALFDEVDRNRDLNRIAVDIMNYAFMGWMALSVLFFFFGVFLMITG